MSLQQNLIKPMVILPTDQHTHTVVFLHRFPAVTTEDELCAKVLSAKMTRNHKTLDEQFPSIRWVFPYAKDHDRHWSNLSPQDKTELGLTGRLPYITQIVMQEANCVGSLDKVILGGQGETAEAAHEAMSAFPEPSAAVKADPDAMAAFVQENFPGSVISTDISQLKLAGFVGMHAQDGNATRDVRNYSVASKAGGPVTVNNAIVCNTPHKFINGGYKLQTTTWDGKRIDDFAAFLTTLGVDRVKDEIVAGPSKELLAPKNRAPPARIDRAQDEFDAKQKYAKELKEQKAADTLARDKILQRIEADRVERAIRQAREREARLHAGEGKGKKLQGGVYTLKDGTLAGGRQGHARATSDGSGCDTDFWNEDLEEKDDMDDMDFEE